ncbi:concanavalin A-like lectin/glucanase domain-containing protein [Chytriomyces sp. MP71]|nr:concanavalin A-like lectin/glucanase domain-containing protein [Chytriomyces sp. MP71]
MLHFPFVADNIAVETEFDGALSEVEASHLREDVRNLPRMGKVVETLAKIGRQHALLGTDEDGDGEEVMDLSTRYFFGFKALGVVIPLFQDDQSIATLALCLFQGLDRASLGALPGLLNTLVSHVLVDANAATRFYGDMVFDCLADCTVPGALVRGTAVRNDSWTFESARSRVGVSGTGKYGFEVVLATSGIIQLGWATSDCRFDPEGGEGVGDNSHSYAYDGNRKKKWHSIYTTNNDYGEEWSEGDVITVLLDLNNGLISYLRNGTDLGVAFTEIDTTREWFAAASLAGGQGCAIKFGGPLDGLRHLPDGFASLDSAIRISCPVERLISVDKMVSSGRVIGEEFGNLVPNDFEWIIPSFYYEVQVCVEDADV